MKCHLGTMQPRSSRLLLGDVPYYTLAPRNAMALSSEQLRMQVRIVVSLQSNQSPYILRILFASRIATELDGLRPFRARMRSK